MTRQPIPERPLLSVVFVVLLILIVFVFVRFRGIRVLRLR